MVVLTRRVVALAVVALLVAGAGCGAFDDDADEDREPYDVDDPFGSGLLPGLTEDEVTDRTALADAHYEALEDESFRSHHRTARYDDNGSAVFLEESIRTVAGDGVSVRSARDPDTIDEDSETYATVDAWTDGDESYTRVVNASGEVRYFPGAEHGSREPALPVSILDLYDATDSVSVERTDGAERYRLEGAGTVGTVENAAFELVLSEAGYVESYDIEGTRSLDGERRVVEFGGGFERTDDSELPEPEWLEEARAEFEGE